MPNPSVAWYTKSPHAYNAKHRQIHTRSRCRAVLFNSVLPHLVGCDSPRLKQANGAACDRFRVILSGAEGGLTIFGNAYEGTRSHDDSMWNAKVQVSRSLDSSGNFINILNMSKQCFLLLLMRSFGRISFLYNLYIYIYRIQVLPCQVQTNAFGEIQILAGHTPFPHIFHSIKCFCSYLYYSISLYLYYSSSTA